MEAINHFLEGFKSNTDKTNTSKVTKLMGWLYVYPENIGPLRIVPKRTIANLNKEKKYGYKNWRLPTIEELGIISCNSSEVNNLPFNNDEYYLGYDKLDANVGDYIIYDLKSMEIKQRHRVNEKQERESQSSQINFNVGIQVRLVRTDGRDWHWNVIKQICIILLHFAIPILFFAICLHFLPSALLATILSGIIFVCSIIILFREDFYSYL